MEECTEPEPSYPVARAHQDSKRGHLLLINGPLLGLVVLLLIAASQAEGYLGGIGEMLVIMGLMGLGTLLNLIQSTTTKGNRVGYLIMTVLYGGVFSCFMHAFSHIGNLKPGG
jgi:hypothetical protein